MQKMDKKGRLGVSMVSAVILVIVLLIVVFQVLADTSEDVGYAADNITAASDVYPLTSFFKKKGVILLAFMAGIAITIITAVLSFGKR